MGNIAIIDYGAGNLHTLFKKLAQFSAGVSIVARLDTFSGIDKIILPGVGHFGTAMKNITEQSLFEPLNEFALVLKKPVLGICLGMQLMADMSGEDDGVKGLGWFRGPVKKFSISEPFKYKVPHMGWNTVTVEKDSFLMKNIDENDEFYFLHSYHYHDLDPSCILNKTEYGYSFVSGIENENIFGVQYHPEKSHQSGFKLLKNFVNL